MSDKKIQLAVTIWYDPGWGTEERAMEVFGTALEDTLLEIDWQKIPEEG